MYRTQNFKSPFTWIRRIMYTSIFFLILIFSLYRILEFTEFTWLIIVVSYLFTVIAGQIDELTIDHKFVTIEQKSIVPFFRSKKIIEISNIKSLKKISNQTSNERGWLFFGRHHKNILEINLNNGTSERINGSLHPQGINSIKEMIEEIKSIN